MLRRFSFLFFRFREDLSPHPFRSHKKVFFSKHLNFKLFGLYLPYERSPICTILYGPLDLLS